MDKKDGLIAKYQDALSLIARAECAVFDEGENDYVYVGMDEEEMQQIAYNALIGDLIDG
jgi:hypothetical protein